MQRIVGAGFLLLIGLIASDAFIDGEQLSPAARWPVIGIAAALGLYLVAASQKVRPWLPRVEYSRQADRWNLSLVAPEKAGKGRLRRETMNLARELREFVTEAPSQSAMHDGAHDEALSRMKAAETPEEAKRIWNEFRTESGRQWERARMANHERFGGRVQAVADEYQRRGMLDPGQARRLLWNVDSTTWMVECANRLEALAKRL